MVRPDGVPLARAFGVRSSANVRVKVMFRIDGVDAAVSLYSRIGVYGKLWNINCLYSYKRVMLKLGRRRIGHLVTLLKSKCTSPGTYVLGNRTFMVS